MKDESGKKGERTAHYRKREVWRITEERGKREGKRVEMEGADSELQSLEHRKCKDQRDTWIWKT